MIKLKKWFEAERGRVTEVAAACGITHAAVSQWRAVPADKVLVVEQVTGISRHELRADIFGPAPEAAA